MACQNLTSHPHMKRSEILALLPNTCFYQYEVERGVRSLFTFPCTTKIVQILTGDMTTRCVFVIVLTNVLSI